MRLNLGCGRDSRPGWVNIDCAPGPGVDHVIDFDGKPVLPFADSTVEHSQAVHVIEHLHHPLPFMEELWRVTEPGGTVTLVCPHGSSDEADEDPTHVRRMYEGSWGYFGQPHHWRANYSYRGDWQAEAVELLIADGVELTDGELPLAVRRQRNIVTEMRARLIAVKPARPARKDQQEPYPVHLMREAAAMLRDASELLYPAVYASILSLGIDPKDGGQDAGMAKAALILARTIDDTDDKDRRHALRDCMPELRQILESLGGSPAARAAITKGAGKEKPPAQVSKLDKLRAASIHKPA